MHILIIEDNADIIANLYGYLEPLGYTLDVARHGKAGVLCATTSFHDAIVLDLSLPGMDGVEVCRVLRQEYQLTTPILMLTARDTEQDKVTGFAVGADDYLVKPYSLPELDARLKALVRRARNEHVQAVLTFDELQLDSSLLRVSRAGQVLDLTPTGYKILTALMRAAPKLLTREELAREVWGDEPPDSDALRTHIHSLRRVLDKPFTYPMLLTLPGTGYRLMSSDEAKTVP
ncbi:response regulator transcription factor [Rheinheimera sp.]|uniref:response regulator transcription factor n=1 Tax=Rheinheimera sp. TaxID=1869214 RepID=UPI002732C104|nr:response regulator transcription factor [Rheinheimera sp.]MDP2713354.1 response regulator transcription factor [Rheinheimera sp.]